MDDNPEFIVLKKDEPCRTYFGNHCTGFGGTTDCYICGWDRGEHEEYKIDWGTVFSE